VPSGLERISKGKKETALAAKRKEVSRERRSSHGRLSHERGDLDKNILETERAGEGKKKDESNNTRLSFTNEA